MKQYQLYAHMAVTAYRRGNKRNAHYLWELAKAEMFKGLV